MRALMWFTIGFIAACALGAYLIFGSGLLLIAGICLIGGLCLFFIKRKVCRILAAVLLGILAGSVWSYCHQQVYLKPARELDQTKQMLTITATDYSTETDYGITFDGTVTLADRDYQVRVYLYEKLQISAGDRMTSKFHFRYTSQGAREDPTYHQGDGIFLLAYADGEYTVVPGSDQSFRYLPQRLRRQITSLLDQAFPADTEAFARALLLGDSSKMTYEMGTDFSVSGIRHVIAVSGLHVSILFSIIFLLCGKKRHLAAFIGIPILILFAAVAGFTPSIVRACVMQSLIILAMLLDTEYDNFTALSFAVLVLLVANPLSITSVSFQLSVSCLIGIFLFSGRINQYLTSRKWIKARNKKGFLGKLLRGGCLSISVSLSTWVVTVPLCAIHFGMISIVGILTNLLTVWMVTYIFWGIILICVAAAVWLPAGIAIAGVVSWPMRLVQWIAWLLSRLPFAAVYTTDRNVVLWLVFCYALMAAFLFVRFRRPQLLCLCAVAGLLMAQIATLTTENLITDRVTILDVGQGQCILIKTQGVYYMVDCGGSYDYEAADAAAEYLLSRGVYQLEGLILTHYDDDHAGAAQMLLTRVGAKQLYLPDIDEDSRIRQELIQENPGKIQWVEAVQQIPGTNMTLIAGDPEKSDNESGICVLFQLDNCDILITGDRGSAGERALMQVIDLPKLELLIAGHHGAANATGYPLLQQTMPEAVVISVGKNSFGHPAEELLERLEQFSCRVMRTDQQGTIEFGR